MAKERMHMVPMWNQDKVEVASGLHVWTVPISIFLERLTDAQWRKFATLSYDNDTTIKEEIGNILAMTIEPGERHGTLSMAFRGVPGPGAMLPDGSTHT